MMRKAMTAAAAVYPGGAMVTVAVCDDGAVLAYAENQNQWVEFPPVPQPEPEAVAATAIDHDHIESRPGVDHLYRIMAWVAGGRSTILVADLKAAIAEITRLRAQPEPVSISSTSQEAAKIDTGSGWREKLTALVEQWRGNSALADGFTFDACADDLAAILAEPDDEVGGLHLARFEGRVQEMETRQ